METLLTHFWLCEFPGAILTNAFGINNRGDIVGNFMNADQSDHGFLLSGANSFGGRPKPANEGRLKTGQ